MLRILQTSFFTAVFFLGLTAAAISETPEYIFSKIYEEKREEPGEPTWMLLVGSPIHSNTNNMTMVACVEAAKNFQNDFMLLYPTQPGFFLKTNCVDSLTGETIHITPEKLDPLRPQNQLSIR